MNSLPTTGSDVLCDDILGLILSQLSIKELSRFQRLSQQFRDCTQKTLRRRQSLAIGFDKRPDYSKEVNVEYITRSIDLKAIDISNGFNGKDSKDNVPVLKKLPRVQRLYIRRTRITFETMKDIVKHLPHLREICFFEFPFFKNDMKRYTSRQWAELLANVRHITIGYIDKKYVTYMADIIREMTSLQSLHIYYMSISSVLLVDCLPPNIRSLKVMRNTFDTQSIDSLTTKCHQIQELSLISPIERHYDFFVDNGFGERFVIICDRLKNVESLTIQLAWIPGQVFAERIAKLPNIRHLAILSHSSNSMSFNTTSMTPLTSLRSLSLYGIKCSPEMWSQLAKVVPNLRQLSLDEINCHVDCGHSIDPEEECLKKCCQRFMTSVANHPKLKALTFGDNEDNLLRAIHLCKRLDQLCIHTFIVKLEFVYEFITETLADRHRVFRLGLLKYKRAHLLRRMAEMSVQIPRYLQIKSCGMVGHHMSSS